LIRLSKQPVRVLSKPGSLGVVLEDDFMYRKLNVLFNILIAVIVVTGTTIIVILKMNLINISLCNRAELYCSTGFLALAIFVLKLIKLFVFKKKDK
jgi:hypothetical protein